MSIDDFGWLSQLFPDPPPADIVPSDRLRPDRATVDRLLAAHGRDVEMTEMEMTENVDGEPIGLWPRTVTGQLDVNLTALGWTQAEYDDLSNTQHKEKNDD